MTPYVISYDLCNPGRNYEKLYSVLENLFSGKRILESVWIVESEKTTRELYNYLCCFIDVNDKIFVGQLTEYKY